MLVSGTQPIASPGIVRSRTRALIAFAAFCAGLCLAHEWAGGPTARWWLIATVAAGLLSLVVRRPFALPLLTIAAILFGAGWYTLRTREAPPDALDRLATPSSIITLEGLLLDPIEPVAPVRLGLARFTHQPEALRTRLDARAAITSDGRSIPVSGTLWVRIDGDLADLVSSHAHTPRAGDAVRITGTFLAINGPDNPGERDLRPLARQWGVSGSLRLSSPQLIIPISSSEARAWQGVVSAAESVWLRSRAAMRARASLALARAVGARDSTTIADDPAHALLAGLLLGIYDESGTDLRSAFSRVGLAHVLSISGFHLAVMAGVMLFLIRLTGDRGALEPLIVAAMVLLYLMIVPAGSPLARSAAMVLLLLLGEALGRRYDRVTLLIWIAVALLVWRPLDLWNLGFQLSVGLTGLLLWRASSFHARLFGAPLRGTIAQRATALSSRIRHAVTLAFSCAILCWIVSTPLILQTTGILSPIAILATILLTPLIVMSLWIGYVALLLGTLWPDAAAVTGPLLGGLARLVVACVQWGDSIPAGSVRLWPLAPLWAVGGTLVALAWVRPRPEREGSRGRSHRRWSRLVATAIVLLWAGQQWWGSSRLPRDVLLRIDTLSVGNGTCHIIRSGDAAMLWDAGPMRSGGVLPPLLTSARALNVWRVPTLVVTHPDTDHFAGADVAVETLGVREMITSPRTLAQASAKPGASAAALLSAMHERGISVRAAVAEQGGGPVDRTDPNDPANHATPEPRSTQSPGTGSVTTLGAARVEFLSPPPGAAFTEDNDHSLVALFEVNTAAGPRRLLMTGDIGPEAIRTLREHPALTAPAIDILEVPHHGSFNEASLALVLELAPRVIIQSTGPARLHDARWTAARDHSTWLSTAESGAFWIQIHQDGTITRGR